MPSSGLTARTRHLIGLIGSEYRAILDKEIIQKSKSIIFSFNPEKDVYQFKPYAHAFSPTSVEDLAELMRHNLFFYAFGEEEVVNLYGIKIFQKNKT